MDRDTTNIAVSLASPLPCLARKIDCLTRDREYRCPKCKSCNARSFLARLPPLSPSLTHGHFATSPDGQHHVTMTNPPLKGGLSSRTHTSRALMHACLMHTLCRSTARIGGMPCCTAAGLHDICTACALKSGDGSSCYGGLFDMSLRPGLGRRKVDGRLAWWWGDWGEGGCATGEDGSWTFEDEMP